MRANRPAIKVVTYGGKVGWFLRKHFSRFTSSTYLRWQYARREWLFKRYINLFDTEYAGGRVIPMCLVSIETVNRCNGVCSFCPANRYAETRPFKKMDEGLFCKIIADLREIQYDGYLNLYVNNEPMIDTRIEDWYIYAHEQLPKAKMLLYTNGTLMNRERFKKIIPVLSKCIINNYTDTWKVQDNLTDIQKMVRENAEYWDKDITIQMRYSKEILTNRAGEAPNNRRKNNNHMICVMPYTDFTVYPDGTVGLCCCDALEKTHLANLNEVSVWEVWSSRQYQDLRKVIGHDRSNYPFCRGCDFVDAGIRNAFMKEKLNAINMGIR